MPSGRSELRRTQLTARVTFSAFAIGDGLLPGAIQWNIERLRAALGHPEDPFFGRVAILGDSYAFVARC